MKIISSRIKKSINEINVEFSGEYDYDKMMAQLNKKYKNNIDGLFILDYIDPIITTDGIGLLSAKVKLVDKGNNYFNLLNF